MAKQTLEQYQAKLNRWARMFPNESVQAFEKAAPGLRSLIQDRYLSGQVLGVVTGNLRRSIESKIKKRRRLGARWAIGTAVQSPQGFGYGAYWYYKGRDFLNPGIRRDLPRVTRLVAEEIMRAYPKGAING